MTYLDIKLAEISITKFLYLEIKRVNQKSPSMMGTPLTVDTVNVFTEARETVPFYIQFEYKFLKFIIEH